MAKWKLSRQIFGCEEFTLSPGDTVTVGRGNNNIITLSSAVISRNHCVINVQNNKALITDLQSSNGVYIGTTKIPPNTPYVIEDSDVIGFGWTVGAPLVNIKDNEKYVFKLIKDKQVSPIISRIQFQDDSDLNNIEAEIAKFEYESNEKARVRSPLLNSKPPMKRKINDNIKIEIKQELNNKNDNENCIIDISDSDCDVNNKIPVDGAKKARLQPVTEETEKHCTKTTEMKNENDLIEYDAFNVKQEYLGYDDEPIYVSDSESDSESEQWFLRLSQNSPGKPFIKMEKPVKEEVKQEDGSYSQMDDDFIGSHLLFEDDEDLNDDIINPNPELEEKLHEVPDINKLPDNEEFSNDIILIGKPPTPETRAENDDLDGCIAGNLSKETEKHLKSPPNDVYKKAQMIEPLAQLRKGKSHHIFTEAKTKQSTSKLPSSKLEKVHSKKQASTTQKEERKKKLREIALKVKENEMKSNRDSIETNKPTTNVKVTSTNRGAFLTEVVQAVVKPAKRKENLNKIKGKNSESPTDTESKSKELRENLENRGKAAEKERSSKEKSKGKKQASKSSKNCKVVEQEVRVPLQNLRPLTDTEESYPGKPVSKVVPMPLEKPKKIVRFSLEPPQVRVFEIEPGNKLKKTSLVKTTLIDFRKTRVFSLEKITLMKILRWNPHWLQEQLNNNDPPPILGHNNTPMTLFHSFVNHNQYVQLVGDLLLMEIWECLTIAYMKTRTQNIGLQMRIDSLPPIPTQDRCFDLFNLSVNVALLPSETRNLPRVGEIMLITFGSENVKHQRFFFVHNIRYLPAAPGQTKHFYSISLHATVTEKIRPLRPGEIIIGISLAYIKKELMLFEAMEYLAGSPLSDAILRPEPHHFISAHNNQIVKSQWTATLNPSQLRAVSSSVAAALSDKPSIQMVQGPPGTGKSSVICAIVMTYFYSSQGKKQQNRGKILICATSNAAVDGLVIRLLNLRQSLPKPRTMEDSTTRLSDPRLEHGILNTRNSCRNYGTQTFVPSLYDASISRNSRGLSNQTSHVAILLPILWRVQGPVY